MHALRPVATSENDIGGGISHSRHVGFSNDIWIVGSRLGGKLALYRLKQRGIENRLMLPAMNLATIGHLANIEAVFQQIRERTHAETAPANRASAR